MIPLKTLLICVILPVVSGLQEDPYRYSQKSGPVTVAVPAPSDFKTLKINNEVYIRTKDTCQKTDDSAIIACRYNDGIATADVPDASTMSWIGFEMPFGADSTTGYVTAYFHQENEWTNVKSKGCIEPMYSSQSIIYAKDESTVNIKCGRQTRCSVAGDVGITISMDGKKICETPAEGRKSNTTPLCVGTVENMFTVYSVDVEKPAKMARSFVFCSTRSSQLSVLIDWTTSANPYLVNVTFGQYEVAVPVPGDFKAVHQRNMHFRREGDKCFYDNAGPFYKCSYSNGIARFESFGARRTPSIGFEIPYGKDEPSGIVTAYFTQGSTWGFLPELCIDPIQSTPSIIDATNRSSVKVQCVKKTVCPSAFDKYFLVSVDNILIHETGADRTISGIADVESHGNWTFTTVEVKKPERIQRSFFYCRTRIDYYSILINWEPSGAATAIHWFGSLLTLQVPIWAFIMAILEDSFQFSSQF